MQFIRYSILLTLCTALPATTLAARADGHWPPLNAIEERSSHSVQVGKATFTTGYYSWYVPEYSEPSLHYSEPVNIGPREWWLTIGLGGAEPIGPRSGSSSPPVRQAPVGPVTTLSPVAPLPSLTGTLAPLPGVSSLPSVPNIDTLPSLPSLSP